ncbi:helix-turn-helix domain-containing protein [Patulibacter defluvii]|uniref:helix-turn-helix domain-containing protein n=1 Tax=Patulibacter defluvii TaxID=3095358 RepID=UPI002A74BD0C|nr:helix-turn-helix transcriptional regulator [Patulibacter sp. DM4]
MQQLVREPTPASCEGIADLTHREQEVLRLVACGCSNEEICERLWISGKTLEHHIHRIYLKLGLAPSRSIHRRVVAARRWAAHEAIA